MSLTHLAKYALTLPPRVAAAKGWRHGRRIVGAYFHQAREYWGTTFAGAEDGIDIAGRVAELDPDLLRPMAGDVAALAGDVLEHRFDLLGSGRLEVAYGMRCPGFEGHRYPPGPGLPPGRGNRALAERLSPGNRARARAIWELVDPDYRPIDWQLDFKSGYRWSERSWSGTIRYGHLPGVDVKVPWELARLQHLPMLAWAYLLAGSGAAGFRPPEAYRDEFRNQVLDFLASNPPRFGVNWACTMDVAIRAANLALGLDLLVRHGARFDRRFLAEFAAGLRAHGRHVAANLEWHDHHRANHYLADIAGLLFVAAYLPGTAETDRWLAFAVRQLIAEVERQFTADGANFEASTAYHRLSAEIAVHATALVLGLPDGRRRALDGYDHRGWDRHPPLPPAPVETHPLPGGGPASPFPGWYFERLQRMAEFSIHVTKPGGRVVQIGDNDSGRFLKLGVPRSATGDPLDHRGLVGAANGLFGRDDLAAFAGPTGAVETAVVEGLAGGRRIAGHRPEDARPPAEGRRIADSAPPSPPPGEQREIVVALPDPTVLDGLRFVAYPDFGVFIWRTGRFFLSVRCGPVGQDGNGGHAHNDQLAVELNVDGEDWIADPGTYVYTPSPRSRDAYRSLRAHAAPRLAEREPARLDLGMFRLEDRAGARCLAFDGRFFLGVHHGFGDPVYRSVTVGEGRIAIRDGFGGVPGGTGPGEAVTVGDGAALRALFPSPVRFSPGYGLVEPDHLPGRPTP